MALTTTIGRPGNYPHRFNTAFRRFRRLDSMLRKYVPLRVDGCTKNENSAEKSRLLHVLPNRIAGNFATIAVAGGIVVNDRGSAGGDMALGSAGIKVSRTFADVGDYDYYSTQDRNIKGRVRVR